MRAPDLDWGEKVGGRATLPWPRRSPRAMENGHKALEDSYFPGFRSYNNFCFLELLKLARENEGVVYESQILVTASCLETV